MDEIDMFRQLKRLTLRMNKSSELDAIIAYLKADFCTVEELVIPDNDLSSDKLTRVINALQPNRIRVLDLSYNMMGKEAT